MWNEVLKIIFYILAIVGIIVISKQKTWWKKGGNAGFHYHPVADEQWILLWIVPVPDRSSLFSMKKNTTGWIFYICFQ